MPRSLRWRGQRGPWLGESLRSPNWLVLGWFGASAAQFGHPLPPQHTGLYRRGCGRDLLVLQLVSAKAGEGVCCLLSVPTPVRAGSAGKLATRTGGFALTHHLSLPACFYSKPRLLLLPVVCQRNLFSLLLVVQAAVPASCLDWLLQAMGQDSHVDPWVRTLGDLLRQGRSTEECSPSPAPLSSTCQQQLRCLRQKIAQDKPEGQRKLNWCFSKQPVATGDVAESVFQGEKRKKALEESLELDEEREGKRVLLEEAAFDPLGAQEGGDAAGVEEEEPGEPSADTSAQSPAGAATEASQQYVAGEPRKISQAELTVEVQSFLQVLGRVCFPLPSHEPLQPDFSSFPSFSAGARAEAENAAAGVQRKWLFLHLSWML